MRAPSIKAKEDTTIPTTILMMSPVEIPGFPLKNKLKENTEKTRRKLHHEGNCLRNSEKKIKKQKLKQKKKQNKTKQNKKQKQKQKQTNKKTRITILLDLTGLELLNKTIF